jgi:hypothetical protein
MKTDEKIDYWRLGATIAGVVVGLVVILLLAIIATARSIKSNVRQIETIAREVEAKTQAVWKLTDTDVVIGQVLETSRSIGQHAESVADTLEAPAGQG